jgi:hypothetical protein
VTGVRPLAYLHSNLIPRAGKRENYREGVGRESSRGRFRVLLTQGTLRTHVFQAEAPHCGSRATNGRRWRGKMNFDMVAQRLFLRLLTLILSLTTSATAQMPSVEETSQSGRTAPSAATPASPDDDWHVGVTPYIWFAGLHGAVGILGHDIGLHASFGDILSYLNIGLMGEVEARKKRVLLVTDLIWMRLSDEKGIPLNDVDIQSVDAKVKQFILTPGVGYRVVDNEKLKIDAIVGFRYWHLGERLVFTPSLVGGVSASQNWVDALGGARIHIPLSQKAMITVWGDAGGGGANSDYQVAGLLGYKISKIVVLQAGWRYLDVNYGNSSSSSYNTATSGLLFGVTINLK